MRINSSRLGCAKQLVMPKPAPQRSSPFVFIGLLLLITYFAVNVSQTFAQSRYNRSRLQALQHQVDLLRHNHQQLLQQVQIKQSPQFIESEARNKLNMARANEIVVVFPQAEAVLGDQATTGNQPTNSIIQLPSTISAWQHLFWQ